MDENLTDNERVEQLKVWWRENGWFLIGGVALGALALFGWNQYTAYRDHRSEEAGALYQIVKDAKDPVAANTTLQKMRADFPSSAYTSQAGLLVAGMLVVSATRARDGRAYVRDGAQRRIRSSRWSRACVSRACSRIARSTTTR